MDATTWIGFACTAASGAVTVLTVFFRARARVQIEAIKSGNPEAARIVADAVTSFNIDTSRMTPEAVTELALKELANRDRQRSRVVWASLLLAIVIGVTTVALAKAAGGGVTQNTTTYGSGAVHIGTASNVTIDNRLAPPGPSAAPDASR